MKKILLSLASFILLQINAQQQKLQLQTAQADPSVIRPVDESSHAAKPMNTTVHDTLDYFFNKHYYKNSTTPASNPPNLSFFTLKSPYPGALSISHCGALFLNNSTISISGLKGLVIKNTGSPSASVGVKIYLCNVNASNIPIMPPLDSVLTSVSNSTAGVWAGGSFTAPITVTGNFAVLFQHNASQPGDTIRLFINNAFTPTATVPNSQKFGEGFGIIRFNGFFQTTTNAFGGTAGNDYEFVVAPYISFNLNAGATANTPTVCNFAQGSFGNTTTPMSLIENRQFNFNKFKPYWSTAATGSVNLLIPSTDSIYNWMFTGSPTPPTTAKTPFAIFNTLGNQTGNLTVKYRRQRSPGSPSVNDISVATITVSNGSAPTISVSGLTSFCSNTLITTTLTANGANSYTWSAPISTIAPTVVITQTISTAVYTVMSSNAGCTAVYPVTVTVNALPSVSLSASKNTVCSTASGGSTIQLTGSPSGGQYSGLGVSGNKFTPGAAGTFSLVYSYTNTATGCTNVASTSIVVKNCTGLETVEANQHAVLFPNPSINGKMTLKNLDGKNTIRIYNLLGVLVQEHVSERSDLELDLGSEPSGTFILKINQTGGNQKTLKIVNQN